MAECESTTTDAKLIPLFRKGKVIAQVIVDAEDYEMLSCYAWHYSKGKTNPGYAIRTIPGRGKSMYMHRELLNAPMGLQVDHINGNRLDNRKCNLRLCTKKENSWNIGKHSNSYSQYIGVFWCKHRNAWRPEIVHEGKRYRATRFESEIEAARWYDAMARELRGEFARLNFPEESKP